jgi:Flp pilus assembly protein TadD
MLNRLGYLLLRKNDRSNAIKAFQQNTELYPQSSNVYDSLAEAYLAAGEKSLAVKNYEKALELNPRNEKAATMLKRLRTGQPG